jgi:hypothetical protein
MIETVDELIEILNKHQGKNLLIKDILKQSHSFLLEVIEEDGACVLVKSVRDYLTV